MDVNFRHPDKWRGWRNEEICLIFRAKFLDVRIPVEILTPGFVVKGKPNLGVEQKNKVPIANDFSSCHYLATGTCIYYEELYS